MNPSTKSRWRRARLCIAGLGGLAIVALAAAPGHVAAADPPATLAGEFLSALGPSFGSTGTSDVVEIHCDPTNQTRSYVKFRAEGVATGPYPGTFVEEGTIFFGPLGADSYSAIVDEVDISFMILSGDTRVEGMKSVGPLAANPNGVCIETEGQAPDFPSTIYQGSGNAEIRYTARIITTTGTYRDAGTGYVSEQVGRERLPNGDERNVDGTVEYFITSDYATPMPDSAAALALTPVAATNPVGTSHTVTATASTLGGQPSTDSSILFSVVGSTETQGQCTTGSNGQCSFAYIGPDLPGADSISACADNNNNGACDAGEPIAEATKAWVLPTSTPGHVTGGGQVPDLSDPNGKVAFGFNAKHQGTALKGNCSVVDQSSAQNVLIKCLDVTGMVQSGSRATIFGNAQINGTPTTYRIDVDDLGEPGRGHDTFRIQTGSGYTVSGTLSQGNIQIHQP